MHTPFSLAACSADAITNASGKANTEVMTLVLGITSGRTHNNFQASPQQIFFFLVFSTNKIKEGEEFNVQVGWPSKISLQHLVHHKLLLKANIYYPLLRTKLK